MAQQVCMGAMIKCSFGSLPSSLIVLPKNRTTAEGPPAANIMDHIPIVNIATFGVCSVIGGPCVPIIPAPWAPGSPTVTIGGVPALNSTSKCLCTLGGVISINMPGTTRTNVA